MTQHPGLSGMGGIGADGRWHTAGHYVIYASEHAALSMLEVLAHLKLRPGDVPLDYKMTAIELPASHIGFLRRRLPSGWQTNLEATRTIGNQWLAEGAELALAVPSAILAHATNYLINPRHPAARTLLAEVAVDPIWIDPRVLRIGQKQPGA